MKKTLALLLALLMVFSVVLVSCGDKNNEDDPEGEVPGGFEDDFAIPSGNDSDGEDDDNGNGNASGNTAGFATITENTKAYMLMSVKVRTNYKKSATNGAALYGKEVTRIEANDTWTKIKYTDAKGASKEGFVYNEVLTIDAGRVTYVAEETPIEAKSKTDKVTVRKAPWIGDKYNTVIDEINGVDGDNYKLKKDQAITVLGKTQTADDSGNKWAYIKYMVGETAVFGWCRMDLISTGEAVDAPVVDPTTPGVPQPV